MATPKLTFQDILNQRRSADFVGRQMEQDFFRRNLSLGLNDPERKFIIHIRGQGGIGKTTLMKRFQTMAKEKGVLTAMVDEWQEDVPQVLGEFAEQFAASSHKLESFAKRYKDYHEKKGEVEADPEAPQGFAGFLGRTIAVGGVKMLRRTPVLGGAAELIDENAFGNQASEFASYLARKLKNKDDVELVASPNEALTPLFLENLNGIAESRTIAPFFDTFEKSGSYLAPWLRDALNGGFGDFPANVMFVIAGREPLDQNWTAFEPMIHRINLNPLSEQDAETYLRSHKISNEETIRIIMQLSGCTPLLLATLASQSPNDPAEVGDPSGDAVDRFLKWVEDPNQREAALYGALPLILNQNIFAVVTNPNDAGALFTWLKKTPFVKEVKDNWIYHEVVRSQMLRFARKNNPQKWRELHQSLETYFQKGKAAEQSGAESLDYESLADHDEDFALYHQLCATSENALPYALNRFLDTLKVKKSRGINTAEMIKKAGTDTGSKEIENWGARLLSGLNVFDNKDYTSAVNLFSDLLEFKGVNENKKAICFDWRGEIYFLMGDYESAFTDANRAIELNEKDQRAISRRGQVYFSTKNYDAALKEFNRAVELDEKVQWIIAMRSATYRLIGEKYQLAAETDHAMENYKASLQDMDRAVALNDKVAWIIVNRGETCRLMGNYEATLKDFNRALELDEKVQWARVGRARTYLAMENYEAALQDFNRTIEFDEKEERAIAFRLRGEIYLLMGNYDKATQDFASALAIDPENDMKKRL